MFRSFATGLFCVSIFVVSNVYAQKGDKPFNTWSKGEAEKVITESPWAKVYTSSQGKAATDTAVAARDLRRDNANSGGGNPGSVARIGGNLPIVIRLHSAPIIRQATVRIQQINVKYDKMSESERAAFDASRKGYLDCTICKDYYVVTIMKYTDTSGEVVNDGIFQTVTLEDIKGNVSLVNDKGETRELVQFTPSKGAGDPSIFFFKRNDENGKPLLTADSKELEFVFSNRFIEWNKRDAALYPRKFEFPLAKMIVDGQVIF